MTKATKATRDRKLLEERVEMFDEFISRKGDPRIQKLAEEKRVLYGLVTIEKVMEIVNEKVITIIENQEKEREKKTIERRTRFA